MRIFLTSLLAPVAVETELSQRGLCPPRMAVRAGGGRGFPRAPPPAGTIPPPPASWPEPSAVRPTPIYHCVRGLDGNQGSIFPLGNQPAIGALAGRVGEELPKAGDIYNLCLVPARLDAHSCFPPYNKIKQHRDISSLLTDEIPASASPLRPAQGCSLFLRLKTSRVTAAGSSTPKWVIC